MNVNGARLGRLGLCVGATLALFACGQDPAATALSPAEEQLVEVATVELEPRPVTQTLELAADLVPWRRAVIAAEVAGVVEEVAVEAGESIRAGTLLARVDTRALAQQVAEAEALYGQAADQADRAEKLFERRSITRSQLVDATAGRDVTAARLDSARLALEKAEVDAPWTGEVSSRYVEVGDYVAPGQRMFELLQADPLRVQTPLPAGEIATVGRGTAIVVRVDAYPDERFEAIVVRVGAEADPRSRTVLLEAELENPDRRLVPGLPARVEVVRRHLPAALTVPLAAIVELEGATAVFVVEEGVARRRIVTLGSVVGQLVVVEGGLVAGDRVVVAGQQLVSDGQRVEELAA